MNSIFTIERRRSFSESFRIFFEDLQSKVTTTTGIPYPIFEYLNYCLRYWPYRCGATGIDDYLRGIGIDITNPKEDKELLLILELLINLLYWAPKQDSDDNQNAEFSFCLKKNDVENESERLIGNAKHLLEQCCNMTIRKEDDECFSKYFITKRNAQIDVAVVAVPELKDVLLGYMDFRNKDDIEYKKAALTAIYRYMEPHRKDYKSLSVSAVSEEFFASINTFGIRHNTKSQMKMREAQMAIVCDNLFMMAIFVLQSTKVIECQNDLKVLREKKE